ncbi:helix-turn-helix domain-containing protein [Glacieibacterium frigidum]|uniref:Helix-turn-helix domain-containing protein n=1 Tax=Glacieibacterium frigidum TaxID=2593303 RepID=A0A552UGR5_9SPHN|nr:helix-turn-helix domain-containing protein [Glacieibacterium frigidum]TRW17433.1 helix-turn-helix domain-containing protein [Glacieibacterium frigidum]
MDQPAPVIPTMHLTTADLPEDRQFAAWASFTTQSRVTRPGTGPFFAEADFWNLDRMLVSVQTTDAFTMDRDAQYLQSTAANHFLIVVPYTGEYRFTAPGIDEALGPGDVVVANLNRLGRCDIAGRAHSIGITMSRAFLEEAGGMVDVHGVLPRTPETRLFVAFLRSLVEQLPSTAPASVAPLSRIVRDLFANAVAGIARPEGRALATTLRARAHAYIRAQPPGSLDVERMIADLATTRSSLFRLFRDEGGVLTFDRRRRLRLVHRAVADPLDHRTLGEIGFDCGFEDAAHLANQFKASFGYSMSDLRGHINDHPVAEPAGATPAELYRRAVAALV